jgi:hypothetical protein
MAVKSIVDDYVLAATLRARSERAEHGTIVLTVPEFPGLVACGSDGRETLNELYRRLERLVLNSVKRGVPLPVLVRSDGTSIDLNTPENRALVAHHHRRIEPAKGKPGTEIDSPEALEKFFDEL